MSAYVAGEWNEFCVAVLGATAALSGLLFASVAINIERIMADPRLPNRALQTLIFSSRRWCCAFACSLRTSHEEHWGES